MAGDGSGEACLSHAGDGRSLERWDCVARGGKFPLGPGMQGVAAEIEEVLAVANRVAKPGWLTAVRAVFAK